MTAQQHSLLTLLEKLHGKVRKAREKHGLHFYIPCPDCVKRLGAPEKRDPHLAINVDMLEDDGNTNRCLCHKCGSHFSLNYLTHGATILLQAPSLLRTKADTLGDAPRGLFAVGTKTPSDGARLMSFPGTCVPLSSLPENHVAVNYLKQRKFDLSQLERAYDASWCTAGIIYGSANARKPLSVTNRIILYGKMYGAVRIWQARMIDYTDDRGNYFVYNDNGKWEQISTAAERLRDKDPVNPPEKRIWCPPKYLTSDLSSKSSVLINLDSAVKVMQSMGFGNTVVLCEGILDAARIGDMGVPLLGKTISAEQTRLLQLFCTRVVIMLDPAEKEAMENIKASLRGVESKIVTISGYKDPGDAPHEYLWTEISKALTQ